MPVYILLIDPTPADLTLAGRIAVPGNSSENVMVSPIIDGDYGQIIEGGRFGIRIPVDRTVRRPPRPRKTKVLRRAYIS